MFKTADAGATWAPQSAGLAPSLADSPPRIESLAFVDAQTGWAVGQTGPILTTTDGGTSWVIQDSPVNDDPVHDLYAVVFVDSQSGWVAGQSGTILRRAGTYPTQVFAPLLTRDHAAGW